MATADPALEKRAQEIFERQGDGVLSWSLPEDGATAGAEAPAAVSEAAKEEYRRLAGKELAAEGRS